jgi:hypothetical protein
MPEPLQAAIIPAGNPGIRHSEVNLTGPTGLDSAVDGTVGGSPWRWTTSTMAEGALSADMRIAPGYTPLNHSFMITVLFMKV